MYLSNFLNPITLGPDCSQQIGRILVLNLRKLKLSAQIRSVIVPPQEVEGAIVVGGRVVGADDVLLFVQPVRPQKFGVGCLKPSWRTRRYRQTTRNGAPLKVLIKRKSNSRKNYLISCLQSKSKQRKVVSFSAVDERSVVSTGRERSKLFLK